MFVFLYILLISIDFFIESYIKSYRNRLKVTTKTLKTILKTMDLHVFTKHCSSKHQALAPIARMKMILIPIESLYEKIQF